MDNYPDGSLTALLYHERQTAYSEHVRQTAGDIADRITGTDLIERLPVDVADQVWQTLDREAEDVIRKLQVEDEVEQQWEYEDDWL